MLLLLLLQVLASCLWLGRSEVVTSFQSCLRFFFRETPPNDVLKPNNPAWICQLYNNEYHFATLYNRDLRIPVYSAYTYKPRKGPRPHIWMIEPQLIGSNYSKTMMKEDDLMSTFNVTLEEIKNSQAISQDYRNLKGLHSCRLNPSVHQPDDMSREATFTLTNIVPQNAKLNVGAWKNYVETTMTNKTKGCTTTYVVVGTVPGNNYIASGRVNVPSYIWSSACCEMGKKQMKAWAVIAENDKNAVQLLTLGDLEDRLTELYGEGKVSLFHSDCPR
ncbi:PREDICTED: endonuclease domain-containing 1 protein-like [Calidris pugnax]|uniref:endonuclease domain-containing 1 protein-like n=1 Tax=Calidris pugnax TaxID=198806 RepID=UPI00071C2C95|nr:PREDICTED: endonuclease domain-containing 1 protein-like [Calidris pugnax]